MSHRRRGLLTGALATLSLLAIAPGALATTASVRIVGDGVGAGPVTIDTTTGTFGPDDCPRDSAGGAIDQAVGGNWDQRAFVSTILGESHTYADSDYWNFWINDTYAQAGICSYTVQPGDRILMLVQRDSASSMPTVFPLTLSVAPTVFAGVPFTVTIREQRTDGTTTTPTPIAGATVSGGGQSAVTDAAGHATLTFPAVGAVTLTASKTGDVASDPTTTSVVAVAATGPAGPNPLPCAGMTDGHDGACGTVDRDPPKSTITGIRDGQRFTAARAPRTLRASVTELSGLLAVKFRLTRTDGPHCTYFSGGAERFKLGRHGRCGASNGFWFGVGASRDTSYLLPSKLPRGRYVLDVEAIDKAYNRDAARRRGVNRVVFHVA
jgi:hypothetical protein